MLFHFWRGQLSRGDRYKLSGNGPLPVGKFEVRQHPDVPVSPLVEAQLLSRGIGRFVAQVDECCYTPGVDKPDPQNLMERTRNLVRRLGARELFLDGVRLYQLHLRPRTNNSHTERISFDYLFGVRDDAPVIYLVAAAPASARWRIRLWLRRGLRPAMQVAIHPSLWSFRSMGWTADVARLRLEELMTEPPPP